MTEETIRGMKPAEAILRATNWWNTRGRHQMKLGALRQLEPIGGSNKGNGGAFASLDPTSPNFLPSGILHGFEWDQLSAREKQAVVKAWLDTHHPLQV